MKQNYKTGDEIKVIAPTHFAFGHTGTVLTNNTQTNLKPVNAILDGGLGSWQFSYTDIQSIKENAPTVLKSSETAQQINTDELTPAKIKAISKMGIKNVADSVEKSEPKKRGRKSKGEVKPIKIKRAYKKRQP